jgi:hypothetical protein
MRQLLLIYLILTALLFELEAQVTLGSPKSILPFDNIERAYVFDVDGDGDEDLIAQHDYTDAFWYEQTSTQDSFAMPKVLSGVSGSDELQFDDVDGDGDLDIITCSTWNNISYNEGDGNFTDAQSLGIGARSLYFDYDLDGDKDLIVYSIHPNLWYLYLHERVDDNGVVFAPPVAVIEQYYQDPSKRRGIHAITPFDLNGDGYKELLIAGNLFLENYEPQGSFLYYVNNQGTIGLPGFPFIEELGYYEWGGGSGKDGSG